MCRSLDHHVHTLVPQVAALSNAAGVGGGAIFVPLFNVLLSFSIKNVRGRCTVEENLAAHG